MDYSWHPDDGSEAQNIIRQAEAPPDSPFRPRYRRRSGELVPLGMGGTVAPPAGSSSSSSNKVQAIKLGVLLGKKPVADALSRFLTLRDVFKMGASCRELMRRLLTVSGAASGAGSSSAPEPGGQQQQQQGAAAAAAAAGPGIGNGNAGGEAGGGGAAAAAAHTGPLMVHIRGAKEFLAYFRALEQNAAWTQQRMMAVSIVLDYHDSIDGPIPAFLGGGGGVSTVEWLDLGRSNLTGGIPDNLGTLPNLRKLYLAGNQLVGAIPSSLGDISTLSDLSLAGNELSGPIPDSFGNLTLLRYLSLRDNKLSGSIPESLGNLVNLEELWLNANQIEGEIPASFGNMATARKIFLNNNSIEGTLPASLGNLSSLRILSLRHNRLTGTVPPELGRLSQLKTLYMEKNQLEGTIPDTLANLASLEELNLLGNQFQGKAQTRNLLIGQPVAGLLKTVTVELEDRSYPIYIGEGILESGDLLRRHVTSRKALVITNDKVGPLYLAQTVKVLEAGGVEVETVVLPDGEEFKSLEILTKILDKALSARLDRKTTFVALGGGVIGDMVGFAAAIYQRGVKFVQVPTTLMAMVDSAVGGKTAVNHPLGKNMIGAFYQPQAVLADTDTLKSLPDRELSSGIAEVVKYGLIKDSEFFQWQEGCMETMAARDAGVLAEAVERSCINKALVVAADEKEAGLRATLNLGHTFGHAIETGLGYGKLLHGEAVAIGMHMAADLSCRMGWVDQELVDRSVALMEKAGLPVELPKGGGMDMDKFLDAMAVDKKVADGELRLILLKGELGGCVMTGDFDEAAMRATIQDFCDRQ
eukprot:g11442.t1